MTYAHTLSNLASSVDRDFEVIPHPKVWAEGFRDLKERRVEGHHDGSQIGLWPIGSQEIFEGQARFSQIQYLSEACGHRLDWDEFLHLTETCWPSRINDSIVSLFLLVCDLSINPGSGFPFAVAHGGALFGCKGNTPVDDLKKIF
jgi:hypothetical protein